LKINCRNFLLGKFVVEAWVQVTLTWLCHVCAVWLEVYEGVMLKTLARSLLLQPEMEERWLELAAVCGAQGLCMLSRGSGGDSQPNVHT
jgi:hypothetical protein